MMISLFCWFPVCLQWQLYILLVNIEIVYRTVSPQVIANYCKLRMAVLAHCAILQITAIEGYQHWNIFE